MEARYWESPANFVVAGPADPAAEDGEMGPRALVGDDIADAVGDLGGVVGVAADYALARSNGTLSLTGTSNINTGLTGGIKSVVASLAEAAAITGTLVTCSALASAGWFQVQVWMPTTSSNCTPTAATTAKLVYWEAVGTIA